MKKIILGLLFLAVLFAGCQIPNNTPDSGKNNSGVENTQDLAAIAVWNKLVGTKWEVDTCNGEHQKTTGYPDVVIFADDSVTLDNVQYSVNKDEFVFSGSTKRTQYMTLKLNNITWELALGSYKTNPLNDDYKDLFVWLCKDYGNSYILEEYKFVSSTNQSSGGDTSSVNGTYSFSNATGTQKNGSITLSDGNWTYSGSKTNAPSGGTYTVNGSDITFSWTANGYDVSTTVTVSKNGSSVTLSSSEVVFFSTFFNSTAQSDGKYSLTFSYTE